MAPEYSAEPISPVVIASFVNNLFTELGCKYSPAEDAIFCKVVLGAALSKGILLPAFPYPFKEAPAWDIIPDRAACLRSTLSWVSPDVAALASAAWTPTGREANVALANIPDPAKAAGPSTAANAGKYGLISFGIIFWIVFLTLPMCQFFWSSCYGSVFRNA